MKAATLRLFLSVHSWMGLLAGMALFIAFYAGAITVFTHELSAWQPAPVVEETAPADPVAAAQSLLDTVIATHPQVAESFLLLLPGEHGPIPRLYWYGAQADASGGMRQYQAAPDGGLLELPQRVGFADFLYDLHFTAGLPRVAGTYLFGVVSVLYGLALVSGVVLYAPVFFKDLFALRIGANLKRLWQDAHNLVGMLSLPFHVIFAWSGAVLCLGVLLLAPFQFLVFDGKLMQILEPDFELAPHVAPAKRTAPLLPIAALLDTARAASPGFVPESLAFHDAGDANARVEVYGHHDQRRLNTLGGVALDATTGQVLRVLAPATMSPGTAALRGLQALHFGNFGHAPVRWLYFLLGLGGAFLFYSGNLLWIETRRKRRQLAQPRRTHAMARLTVGICLGSVAGISALFIAARVLPQGQERSVYYAVFAAVLVWALIRPTARGAYEVLLACAGLTALIPLASCLSAHGVMLPWQDATALVADLIALVLAWAYWQLARASKRRGLQGDPSSVWAWKARAIHRAD